MVHRWFEIGNKELRIYQEKYHCINDFFFFKAKQYLQMIPLMAVS